MSAESSNGVVFAFGPENSIFFEAGGERYWHNIPEKLKQLYEDSDDSEAKLALKHGVCLALTSSGGHTLVYTNKEQGFSFDSLNTFHFLPIMQIDLGTASFAVGPNDRSFFVRGSNNKGGDWYRYHWKGLPDELEDLIQYQVARGSHDSRWAVTLGANGSYVMYADGPNELDVEDAWYADGIPEALKTALTNCEDLDGAVIVLNPYVPDQYFCYFNDGSMRWNVDRHHTAGIKRVATAFAKERSEEGSVIIA